MSNTFAASRRWRAAVSESKMPPGPKIGKGLLMRRYSLISWVLFFTQLAAAAPPASTCTPMMYNLVDATHAQGKAADLELGSGLLVVKFSF